MNEPRSAFIAAAGGGTFFADIAEPVNCDAGGVIAFDGSLYHGGHPISRGVRFVAVAFLYAEE